MYPALGAGTRMALEAVEHDGWVEVRGSGRLTLADWVPAEQLPFPRGFRILLDYTEITAVDVPLDMFVHAANVLAERGIKVAALATLDVIFGVSRQTILTAGLPEGEQFAVFRDRDEAISWLLSEPGLAGLD